jgi:putative endonuclease
MSEDRRHRLGMLGEQLAAEHLERRGFRIVERNYRTRWGELDIVAFDGRVMAFVEVKTRRGDEGVSPFEAIRPHKCAQVRRMAHSWLVERRGQRPFAQAMRFDAIGVSFDPAGRLLAIEHLEGAF